MSKLSSKMEYALEIVHKGSRRLICNYGNQFFLAGGTHDDGVCERSTLEALVKRGLLVKVIEMTGRGEYRLPQDAES